MSPTSRHVSRGAVLPLALLAAWHAAVTAGAVDPRILPPLPMVVDTAVHELAQGRLVTDLTASLARDVGGSALGASAGLLVGVLLGLSPGSRPSVPNTS